MNQTNTNGVGSQVNFSKFLECEKEHLWELMREKFLLLDVQLKAANNPSLLSIHKQINEMVKLFWKFRSEIGSDRLRWGIEQVDNLQNLCSASILAEKTKLLEEAIGYSNQKQKNLQNALDDLCNVIHRKANFWYNFTIKKRPDDFCLVAFPFLIF